MVQSEFLGTKTHPPILSEQEDRVNEKAGWGMWIYNRNIVNRTPGILGEQI
jgi:hypothetical protein